ncbi:MAG: methyl-accepting chemotaxis protein [Mangrovicoccus sp.]
MRDTIDPPPTVTETALNTTALNRLSKSASSLGFDVVEIAGFLDLIDKQSHGQLKLLGEAREGAHRISEANQAVIDAVDTVSKSTDRTLGAVDTSIDFVRKSNERSKSVAVWVQSLDEKMGSVVETLKAVESNNGTISSIASQVNILAINAKIEAARAGTAGRGFAVVAEAINELSQKTSQAADAILESINSLGSWIDTLRHEAEKISTEATSVISQGQETDQALADIGSNVRSTNDDAQRIASEAREVERAGTAFAVCFDQINSVIEQTASGIHQARNQTNALIDQSEAIVQQTVALGGVGEDGRFIDYVREKAAEIGQIFEDGIENGKITKEQLFDFRFEPIPGTDPQQVMAAFTKFTDQVLPPIQEKALTFDPKIVFCAAVTKQGYLPTHNRKFGQPQRPNDPVWNAANSRNRRIFDDRVGLKAGRNRESFLLQIYRRDMGGGEFKMMKDLSAPIVVKGTHWGGLRMAFTF